MLKEIMPRANQVAVLSNLGNPGNGAIRRSMETAAMSLKVAIQHFEVRGTHELDKAFLAMAKRRVDAVAVVDDAVFTANSRAISEVALKHRLASAGNKEFAEAGGLVGYGVNRLDMFRRAAYFVDRVLKGAKPADLPVEQATRFELVINLKTAKALGLTIPQSLLISADKVIK
jgi:putative ABC transport system substrate-binding protein